VKLYPRGKTYSNTAEVRLSCEDVGKSERKVKFSVTIRHNTDPTQSITRGMILCFDSDHQFDVVSWFQQRLALCTNLLRKLFLVVFTELDQIYHALSNDWGWDKILFFQKYPDFCVADTVR
jgi:hypothetical protein